MHFYTFVLQSFVHTWALESTPLFDPVDPVQRAPCKVFFKLPAFERIKSHTQIISDHSVLVPLDHVDHVDTCGHSAKSRKLVKVLDLS